VKKLALAVCLAAMAVPASARNAEDYWCGKPRIHLMMWIAKVQVCHPKRVTVVPNRWIRLTKDNIYFRGEKCTVFTEKDQEKYGVGYFGPREDLRYPFEKGKISEVLKRYECQVSEAVEDISTGKPKTATPEYDLVWIDVAQNPLGMKVSHIDKKGNVAERNKQYQNGSYVLLSTDSADTTSGMASPVVNLYGTRTVGSTSYRIVGKMTLHGEGPHYGYYEEIYKNGSLDANIKAGNCSERK
jgi:hypothetical protein